MTNLSQPEAAALFGRAYEICGHDNSDFPYDIEAKLEAIADGECYITAWDAYCAKREQVAA